jgi:hypothetical protein
MGTPWDSDITTKVSAELVSALATHSLANNPHGITPATIGAAPDIHTHLLGSGGGGAIRKTANQTMTATSQTAVADMSFDVAANSTYVFQMHLAVTTSTGTSPTTAWGFTGPAGATVAIVGEIDTSTSAEVSAVLTAFGNTAAGAQVANTGAKFHGVIVTGATAGTVQLTAARGGTTPSMVVPAGCNGFWLKLA